MRAVTALKQSGATVVMVTHKVSLLEEADRILLMGEGCVQLSGTPDQVLGHITGQRPVPTLVPPVGPTTSQSRRGSDGQRSAG